MTRSTRNCSIHNVGNSFRIFPATRFQPDRMQRARGDNTPSAQSHTAFNGLICARASVHATDLPPADLRSLICDRGRAGCQVRRECSANLRVPNELISTARMMHECSNCCAHFVRRRDERTFAETVSIAELRLESDLPESQPVVCFPRRPSQAARSKSTDSRHLEERLAL